MEWSVAGDEVNVISPSTRQCGRFRLRPACQMPGFEIAGARSPFVTRSEITVIETRMRSVMFLSVTAIQ